MASSAVYGAKGFTANWQKGFIYTFIFILIHTDRMGSAYSVNINMKNEQLYMLSHYWSFYLSAEIALDNLYINMH